MNGNLRIVILAAGKGTRMKSELPKALIPLRGMPFIKYILASVAKAGIDPKPVIVVGYGRGFVMKELGDTYTYAVQEEQLGTGHAIMAARNLIEGASDSVLVLPSDHPLVTGDTIRKIAARHADSGATITMATVKLPDFEDWRAAFYRSFSRIVRDKNGKIIKDVQFKDATEEERALLEINPIYLCFKAEWLWKNIGTLKNDNAQKEYYQTDLIKMAMEQGEKIESVDIDPQEALAANSKEELEILEKLMIQ